MKDTESGRDYFGVQVFRAIAALVAGDFVNRAPKPLVLWYGDQAMAAGFDRAIKILQHTFVLINMLDHIEFGFIGQRACIHMQKFVPWHALRGEGKAVGLDFTSSDLRVWKSLRHSRKHEPSTAADF